VAGVAVAGGAGAGTNYIHNPLLGVSVAGAGALVGFAAGLGWDQRQDRLAAAQRWDAVFSDGPGPGPGGQGTQDSASLGEALGRGMGHADQCGEGHEAAGTYGPGRRNRAR